jgi:hypothetical protein
MTFDLCSNTQMICNSNCAFCSISFAAKEFAWYASQCLVHFTPYIHIQIGHAGFMIQSLPQGFTLGCMKNELVELKHRKPSYQGSFFWLQNTEGEPVVGVFATRKNNPASYITRRWSWGSSSKYSRGMCTSKHLVEHGKKLIIT